MTKDEFKGAIKSLGMTVPQAAKWLGVARSTAYNWMGENEHPIPEMAGRLIEMQLRLAEANTMHYLGQDWLLAADLAPLLAVGEGK